MKLYPHQVSGVDWLCEHARGILADEQGLGKTATAIVAADRLRARRVLVVCPAVVTLNWLRELRTWSPDRRVQLFGGRSEVEADTVIVSHGLVWRAAVSGRLSAQRWDVVILDESHLFRTPAAKRTRAVFDLDNSGRSLSARTERMWCLTGTPMPQHPAELWTTLRALAPERIRHPRQKRPLVYGEFLGSFCQLRYNPFGAPTPVAVKQRALPVLRKILTGFVLRRKKSDHLKLPPLRFGTVPIEAEISPELAKLDTELACCIGEDPMEAIRAHGDSVARWRRLCGEAKVAGALELLTGELEGSRHKVIVFAYHRNVLAALTAGLRRFGVAQIDGSVSQADRQHRVDAFQRDARVRVAVCQLTAAGVGITLTAASDVVFVEQSWVPGDNAQAMDRAHRIGQDKSVLVRTLTLADSIDEVVAEVLNRKMEMIRQVLA